MNMKRDRKRLLGLWSWVIAFVWVAVRSLPFITYRYDHPKLTETELQIYFISMLCWFDLVPVVLTLLGFWFIWEEQ